MDINATYEHACRFAVELWFTAQHNFTSLPVLPTADKLNHCVHLIECWCLPDFEWLAVLLIRCGSAARDGKHAVPGYTRSKDWEPPWQKM